MDTHELISKRIRALRTSRDISQETISEALGFKDRQTLSKIESRERRVSAQELVGFAKYFNVPLDFFSDPFRLDGEARFSWRKQVDVESEKLGRFEAMAAGWIALFRMLAKAQGATPRPLGSRVALTSKSSFEDAWRVGEATAKQIGFKDVTSQRLKDSLEAQGILVLYVDAIKEVSGAACQLSSIYAMDVIIINRNEPVFRRKYDLAHEYFHLLTWDVMAPEHVESVGSTAKVEKLADNFAAGLLMPMEELRPYLSNKPLSNINDWLNETATKFGVSSSALRYRLKNCGELSVAEREKIDESKLRNNGGNLAPESLPPLFSRRFIEVVGKGIAEGIISVNKCCSLLDLDARKLAKVFCDYKMEVPFSL